MRKANKSNEKIAVSFDQWSASLLDQVMRRSVLVVQKDIAPRISRCCPRLAVAQQDLRWEARACKHCSAAMISAEVLISKLAIVETLPRSEVVVQVNDLSIACALMHLQRRLTTRFQRLA
jgi:hypothetical protein